MCDAEEEIGTEPTVKSGEGRAGRTISTGLGLYHIQRSRASVTFHHPNTTTLFPMERPLLVTTY